MFVHAFIPPDERLGLKSRRLRSVSAVMQPGARVTGATPPGATICKTLASDFQLEDKTMRAVKLASRIAAVFIALGSAAVHAHELERVDTVFEHAIPNIAGKSLVALVVTYAPGGKSPSHRHAGSAFVYAHVLSGAIRSQVDDEPAKVYRVGEGFHEVPGAHHRVSENASEREPASLLAVFVVDSKDASLTLPDRD